MNKIYKFVLSAVSGGLLILCFPRADFGFLAWVALVPLLVVLFQSIVSESLVYGLVAGFFYFAGLLYWILLFGVVPWLALCLYQGIFMMIFAGLVGVLKSKESASQLNLLIPPITWTIMEWVRSLGPFGFTWGDLGYSQYKCLVILQIASFTGGWGISFLIVQVNTYLARLLLYGKRLSFLIALGCTAVFVLMVHLLGAPIAYFSGERELFSACSPRAIPVGIIQGETEYHTQFQPTAGQGSWRLYFDSTPQVATIANRLHRAFKPSHTLIIWPETAIPFSLLRAPEVLKEVQDLAKETRSYLLIGTAEQDTEGKIYNTALLFSPKGEIIGRYDKVHLVPYGEFVPAREKFPFLKRFGIRDFDFTAGKEYKVFETSFGKFGVMICFESIFPYISRELVNKGARLIVIITNDSWFKRTAAAYEHAYIAVLRAVENRVWVARAGLTGISCFISPWGVIYDQTEIFTRKYILRSISLTEKKTLYTRFGDWFVYLCLIILCVAIIRRMLKWVNPKSEARIPKQFQNSNVK